MEPRDVDLRDHAIRIWVNKTDHPAPFYMTPPVREIIEPRLAPISLPEARLSGRRRGLTGSVEGVIAKRGRRK
jgi:hypothetical protein